MADGVWKPPPVEMVEMVEVCTGDDSGSSTSLQLAGPVKAQHVRPPPPAEDVEVAEVSPLAAQAAAQGQAAARW